MPEAGAGEIVAAATRFARPCARYFSGTTTPGRDTASRRGFVKKLRKKTHESDEFEGALRIVFEEPMCTWVPQAGNSSREHLHKALLLVPVRLTGESIEFKHRGVRREGLFHE